jgi:hypothetical protein
MPTFNYSLSDFVANTKAKAGEINTKLNDLKTFLNTTKLDAANLQTNIIGATYLTDALRDVLGVNGSTIHRGKTIIATEESRINAAYGLMTTPDRVSSVAVPTNGQVFLAYSALWKESVSGAARAAIFIGSNQLKVRSVASGGPVIQAAATNGSTPDTYGALQSFAAGLFTTHTKDNAAHTSDVNTGQALAMAAEFASAATPNRMVHELGGVVQELNLTNGSGDHSGLVLGGHCIIKGLPAGTYDFSVQFKASSGTITTKERELNVVTF